jgi:hypothetical protein
LYDLEVGGESLLENWLSEGGPIWDDTGKEDDYNVVLVDLSIRICTSIREGTHHLNESRRDLISRCSSNSRLQVVASLRIV